MLQTLLPVLASPFDPHVHPPSRQPFFEGWFFRVSDQSTGVSAALIVGAFQASQSLAFGQIWVALLADIGNETVVQQHFVEPTSFAATRWGDPATPSTPDAPSLFEVNAEGLSLVVRDDVAWVEATVGGLTLHANSSARLPWSTDKPDGPGPEGWTSHASALLPCHYYVQSLGSHATYHLEAAVGGDGRAMTPAIHSGHGLAHLETNYGSHFPSGWIWSQAVAESGGERVSLLFAHLDFGIGPLQQVLHHSEIHK